MTDLELFHELPPNEREALGFERWRQLHSATTHGAACYAWGQKHYACSLVEIGRLESIVKSQIGAQEGTP